MKTRRHLVLGLVVITGGLVTAPAGAARVQSARAAATRIVWLKPERVPASRRPALTRLLNQAVLGRPLRGAGVRDSRPQLVSEELAAWVRWGHRAGPLIEAPETGSGRRAP
jgi:uncharacterized membrane protein